MCARSPAALRARKLRTPPRKGKQMAQRSAEEPRRLSPAPAHTHVRTHTHDAHARRTHVARSPHRTPLGVSRIGFIWAVVTVG